MWRLWQNRSDENDIVRDGIEAWRALDGESREPRRERLAQATRARIIETAAQTQEVLAPLPALFAPGRRIALAAILPVFLGVGLLLVGHEPGEAPAHPGGILRAYKESDRVVFLIANGKTSHFLYRSTVAYHFDETSGEPVAGSFADDVNESSPLVFYRIE